MPRLSYSSLINLVTAIVFLGVAWPRAQDDWRILLGFGGICAGALYLLFQDEKPFSLAQMFWLFYLLFFGLIPSFQYRFNSFPWDIPVSDAYLLEANFWIIISMIIFAATYHFLPLYKWPASRPQVFTPSFFQVGLIISLIAVFYIIATMGFENIWSRYKYEQVALRNQSPGFLLLITIAKLWLVFYFFCCLQLYKKGKISITFLSVILLMILVSHFPLATNRISLAIVWGGAALLFFSVWAKRKWIFRVTMLAAILLLFPLLSLFRFDDLQNNPLTSTPHTFSWLASGDFDAYTNFTHGLHVADKNGITHGKQLGGALLFFVPRTVWPEKPIGSGAFIYGQLHSDKFNVSAPLIAEGHINFGSWGVLLFTFIFACSARVMDEFYRKNKCHSSVLFKTFYIILLLFSFQILRGDLMSSMAQLAAIIFIGWLFRYGFTKIRTP